VWCCDCRTWTRGSPPTCATARGRGDNPNIRDGLSERAEMHGWAVYVWRTCRRPSGWCARRRSAGRHDSRCARSSTAPAYTRAPGAGHSVMTHRENIVRAPIRIGSGGRVINPMHDSRPEEEEGRYCITLTGLQVGQTGWRYLFYAWLVSFDPPPESVPLAVPR
jgi:hypothetical protein